MLLDTVHRQIGWLPITDAMMGVLRDTGQLNAIYRAISESNAGAAILVHGGELAEHHPSSRSVTVGENIAAALSKIGVRPLDSINAKTNKSAAEYGTPIASGPVYSLAGEQAHSAPPPVNAAQSVDNGASQGDGNAQRGRRTYDNGIPQGLPAERTTDSDALERIIDAEQRRAGLPEGFQAVAVRQDQLPDALRGALAGLERATGTRVVIFRALTPEISDFNGVTIRDGVLYVSETAQSPATSTAAHEWVHNLRKTNPDLYARLENEVRRQGDAYGFAAKYGYTMGQAHEELTAAAVGDALTDPKFLERLAEHDAGLFTKMARAFLKFLKGFADGWRNQGSDAFLQDVQAFHDVLEEVLHAYERAKPKERAQAGFVKSVFARFQRVWHGTPHRGIETTGFKLNKIGSGEGAQAYGWGMYFASQREVAQRYQPRNKRAEELMMAEYSKAERAGDYESLELWEAALTHKLSDDILSEEEFGHIPITKRDAVARKVREIGKKTSPGGSLYSANIPENDELLDWDKPLSEQPLKVRQIIRQHKLPMYDERDYDAIQLADGSWSIYRIDPDTREAAQVARLDREDARNAQEALAMSGAQFDSARGLDFGFVSHSACPSSSCNSAPMVPGSKSAASSCQPRSRQMISSPSLPITTRSINSCASRRCSAG